MHSDDDGLVMPPALAAVQVVIVPLYSKDAEKQVDRLDLSKGLAPGGDSRYRRGAAEGVEQGRHQGPRGRKTESEARKERKNRP